MTARHNLRMLLSREGVLAALIIVLILLPIAAEWSHQEYLVTQFRRFLIFAVAAISLDLILGYGGMVCFGQAAFVGLGAYTVGLLLWWGQDMGAGGRAASILFEPLCLWVLAAIVGGSSAFVIGLVSLRTSGIYFIMITLAFAQMIYFIFVGLRNVGGDEGLNFASHRYLAGVLDLHNGVVFYYVVLCSLLAVLWAAHRLTRSRFGLVLQGCRENERRMRALGFETFRYKLIAFVIAGALAGFAGGLFAIHELFVSPAVMHWSRSGELIVMVLLGGMGTLVGPILGAIGYLILESFLPDLTEHWMLFFGPALILAVLFAKRGLYGSLPSLRPRAAPAIASAHA
jgi:branched-chain amino acid transport system permease protein